MGEVKEGMVPSDLEMVEETSGKEGPGGEEGLGPKRELLPRLLPEAPVRPLVKSHPVVVKKIWAQAPPAPQGQEQPLPQLWGTPGSTPIPRPS